MSVCQTRPTLEARREFVSTVDRIVEETVQLRSRVAGLLYAGLVLAAQGTEEVGDSGGSTTSGP